MKLPQYSGKDYVIMVWTITPFTIILNSIIFGKRYFTDWQVFSIATLVAFLFLCVSFILYGGVAVAFRNRLPRDDQFMKRTSIIVGLFIIMTGLLILLLFTIYESIGTLNFTFREGSFIGAYSATVVLNIFLTILHEAVAKFASYKATLVETEQLKKEYMQSQLLGLKSQVNPHFLFNGLNSLSSLISEDPDKAERFLDEMSKVYRYLLRNDDEQLVELETELRFINSYYYLLNVRYGEGIVLTMDIADEQRELMIPPLTLQILFENAFNLNSISKEQPLRISIRSMKEGWLEIKNNIQAKLGGDEQAHMEGLDNIINKFRLLCQQTVTIEDSATHRAIRLPLIKKEEMSTV
jgi:two-component system, LytTR family, sensor kinase